MISVEVEVDDDVVVGGPEDDWFAQPLRPMTDPEITAEMAISFSTTIVYPLDPAAKHRCR